MCHFKKFCLRKQFYSQYKPNLTSFLPCTKIQHRENSTQLNKSQDEIYERGPIFHIEEGGSPFQDDLPRAFSSRLFSWSLPPPGSARFPLGHVPAKFDGFDWLRFHNELGRRYSADVPFGAALATVLIPHGVAQ